MSLKLGNLHVVSPAFQPLGEIPKRYGRDGDNKSPPLEWSGAPSGTQQFALVCLDPDAPIHDGFVHWVVYGIPASTTSIPEGQSDDAFTPGKNGMGKPGYIGPYPPPGHGPHHYYFWIYALSTSEQLKPGMTRDELVAAIKDSTLEQARLVGTYER